ncbi:MAG: hypothetical protein ABIM32_03605 [candidate division WOR-3 bacterium]
MKLIVDKDAEYIHYLFLKAVRSKNIKTSAIGKRAKTLINRLVKKYGAHDIIKIISALGHNTEFELWWLFNDETYQKYKKGAEDSIRLGSSPSLSGREDPFEDTYYYYLKNYLPLLKKREMTYQDFLRLLIEPSKTLDYVGFWLAVDPVFRICCHLKVFPSKEVKHLSTYYKTSSKLKQLKANFFRFAYEKGFDDIIKEEINVLLDYAKMLGDDKQLSKVWKILKEYNYERKS